MAGHTPFSVLRDDQNQRAAGLIAHELHQEVVNRRYAIERDFLRLGAVLARIRDERHFEALGHPSFESYLGDPDVNLGQTRAFQLLRVHDVAMLRGWTGAAEGSVSEPLITLEEVAAVGVTKADLIRRKLIDAPDADARREWVDKAMTLSVSDLRKELAEARGLDIDAAWREPVEYFVRRLHAIAGSLAECADQQRALAQLDEVCALSMQTRARLERGQ